MNHLCVGIVSNTFKKNHTHKINANHGLTTVWSSYIINKCITTSDLKDEWGSQID